MFSLPTNVKKVCFVQLFAFMAWCVLVFTVICLFLTFRFEVPLLVLCVRCRVVRSCSTNVCKVIRTTYIGQVMARQTGKEPDVDDATRTGNFAFLMYSIVGVFAGALLPRLAKRDRRLLETDFAESDETKFERIQRNVRAWKLDSEASGNAFKLPRMPVALRDMWCFALLFYFLITLWTFFIDTVVEVSSFLSMGSLCPDNLKAVIAVALVGICWAIVVWAPFAIIMEVSVI